jgi:hypothetical protein
MKQYRKKLVGLCTILFFAAAVLCSTMAAVAPASASEMPDCSRHSAGADPAGADASSGCTFEFAYSVPSKQADIQLAFLIWNTLPKADFWPLVLSVIPQWRNTSHWKPKQGIHLLNSVLTI